jgi:nickel-dependent lactate racemase
MADFHFRYGDGHMDFSYPDEDIMGIIKPGDCEIPAGSEEDKIKAAIHAPIGCGRLETLIKPDETVCLIVPDTTRQWGRPAEIIRVLVAELEAIGIKDDNMLIISAVGTHKQQTAAEHEKIVGKDICQRITVVDHNCDKNLTLVGTSSRGNEIWLNKTAMSYDHRLIVGSTVFHFLAGFGAGRKYILPGIAGRATIMSNHSQYFAAGGVGSGVNPRIAPGLYDDNPVSLEMYEAADMAGVTFNITGVIGPDKHIAFCFAGELHQSHKAATEKCRQLDGAFVDEPAEMVIASGMGYPKDINLYQTMAKPTMNSIGVINKTKAAVQIVVAECREGIGNADTTRLLQEMDSAREREIYTREHYTIGLNVAYMLTQFAEDHHLIFVSSLDPKLFRKSKIHTVDTVDKAIALAQELTGKEHLKAYIMPYAANTCASIKA